MVKRFRIIAMCALVLCAARTQADDVTDLPTVKAVKPFEPLCQGATCFSIWQSISIVEWDPATQELFTKGGGDTLTKEQFCAEMSSKAPVGCDADNPPSTPGFDSQWVSNGCGDGSFSANFAEVAAGLVVPNYQQNLDNPFPGISFLGACRMHDACYSTMVPKANCDYAFNGALQNACGLGSATYADQCQSLAYGMVGAVGIFGDDAYAAGQQARECAAWAADMEENGCES